MKYKYNAGANFEREVKKWLERYNFYVMRSAGSHSLNDLITIPLTHTTTSAPINRFDCSVIQLKIQNDISKSDMDILISDELTRFKQQEFYPNISKYCIIKSETIRVYEVIGCTWQLIWEGNKLR